MGRETAPPPPHPQLTPNNLNSFTHKRKPRHKYPLRHRNMFRRNSDTGWFFLTATPPPSCTGGQLKKHPAYKHTNTHTHTSDSLWITITQVWHQIDVNQITQVGLNSFIRLSDIRLGGSPMLWRENKSEQQSIPSSHITWPWSSGCTSRHLWYIMGVDWK